MNPAKPATAERAPGSRRRFALLRYFSVTSLVCTVITAVAMGAVYRQHEVDELVAQAERENAAFARVLWFTLREEVATLLRQDRAAAAPAVERIDALVRSQAQAFGADKVKIYTPDGLTVYSTRQAEIGHDDEDNEGVVRALRGEVTSSLVHRDQFNAFDHVMANRDLLQTYLPVPADGRNQVIGVFELYSDMTGLLVRIRETERYVMASIAGTLLLLYGVLFAIVFRADRIIKAQDASLQEQMEEIARHNRTLEVRVQERTEALEASNRALRAEISDREAAEQSLALARQRAWQQDKLAAMGRLSAGIVHEVGNPLAAVGGLVATAQEALRDRNWPALERTLERVQDHMNRLEAITREVSGFAVPQGREPELVNLNELLSRVLTVLRYDVKLSNCTFDVALDAELPAIIGVPDQLWQVIMNLVLNAADAIARKAGADRIIALATHQAHGAALLTVRDRGDGMDAETLAKAFEPFHTTKAPGDGLGIGLSLCYAIVQQHGGEIRIESQPNVGTTVRVTLPLSVAPAA